MKEKLENNNYRTLANKDKFSKRKLTLDELIEQFNKDSRDNMIKKESKRKSRK